MPRVHAFGDDALGDLDAVGLADAIRPGRVGAAEVVEAAIARTEAVNPALNGLAYKAFERARAATPVEPAAGFFAGVPTFIKDNVDVAGQPTMQGADAWAPFDAAADSEFTRLYSGHRAGIAGQDADCRNSGSARPPNMPGWGRSATRGTPITPPARRRRDRVRSSPPAWCRSRTPTTAAARSGFRPPATGWSGSSRRAAGCRWTRRLRRMPVGIVANGVLTRSVRDTAAFYREAERIWRNPKLPPIGDVTRPGRRRLRIAVLTRSVLRECSPRAAGADAEVGQLCSRNWATASNTSTSPRCRPVSPTISCCIGDCWRWRSCAPAGARSATPSTVTRLDKLTLGLDRHTGRNLHRLPLAIARLRRLRRRTARFFAHLRRGADAHAGRRDAAGRLPCAH